MENIARWCFRHRGLVVVIWILGIALVMGLAQLVTPHYRDGNALPGTGSQRAADLLRTDFPDRAGESDVIVWSVRRGTVRDLEVRDAIERMLTKVRGLPHVRAVQDPYAPGQGGAVNGNGKVGYASVTFDGQYDQLAKVDIERVVVAARAAAGPRVAVDLGGYGVGQVTMTIDTSLSELVGVLAAMVVLAFAFRSLLSMALPLVSALVSLGPSIALIGVLSRDLVVPSFASSLTILLNLGVGIDYALFLVTRQRRGLAAGKDIEEALAETARTAGKSVFLAGTVVCVVLLGLLGLRIGYLSGMAASAAIGIAFSMLSALTLVPALLGIIGMRVFSRRERLALTAGNAADTAGTGWARWAALVQRRPVVFAVLAGTVIVVLAVPFAGLRLGSSDQGNDPTTSTTRRAYDTLADGFGPGFNAPLLVTVRIPPGDGGRVGRLASAIARTPGVATVTPPELGRSGRTALMEVFPRTSPQSDQTGGLVHALRSKIVPDTGLVAYIGGFTATTIDFTDAVGQRLPPFIVAVVILGALMLMAAFRSVPIAVLTAMMNLAAVSVCFGIVVAIFQWGWFGGILGLGRQGPIDSFLPVFLFAILFGLSMDYQVFLIGRIRDIRLETHDHRRSVTRGQAETGRVITAAAAIMILVFLSFVSGNRLEALFGIALGATVLLDAFVIRTMLVPALLHLMGPASWWMPAWLDRILPRFGDDRSSGPDR